MSRSVLETISPLLYYKHLNIPREQPPDLWDHFGSLLRNLRPLSEIVRINSYFATLRAVRLRTTRPRNRKSQDVAHF
jgi:hypothetical protein